MCCSGALRPGRERNWTCGAATASRPRRRAARGHAIVDEISWFYANGPSSEPAYQFRYWGAATI